MIVDLVFVWEVEDRATMSSPPCPCHQEPAVEPPAVSQVEWPITGSSGLRRHRGRHWAYRSPAPLADNVENASIPPRRTTPYRARHLKILLQVMICRAAAPSASPSASPVTGRRS